jgi:hypothetical protein
LTASSTDTVPKHKHEAKPQRGGQHVCTPTSSLSSTMTLHWIFNFNIWRQYVPVHLATFAVNQ